VAAGQYRDAQEVFHAAGVAYRGSLDEAEHHRIASVLRPMGEKGERERESKKTRAF
jgi:hypothetical protein